MRDHVLERDEQSAYADLDEARQPLRHLDPGEPLLARSRDRATNTARLSESAEMYGNGWPGPTASGVSTG